MESHWEQPKPPSNPPNPFRTPQTPKSHLCPGPGCSQVSSTGGGTGVLTVLVLMSPMMARASLRAWYILSISSLRWACSADSSIRLLWSEDEYRKASSSEWMKSLVWDGGENGDFRVEIGVCGVEIGIYWVEIWVYGVEI